MRRGSAAFRRGLEEAGFVEGRNVAIEYRWAEGRYDRLPASAADLVGRQVSVITAVTTPAAVAAKAATQTIPIVFEMGTDPVEVGLVASLNRPGGNLTGCKLMHVELTPKRLELLSELVPQARLFSLLVKPDNPETERIVRDTQEAARAKGVQLPDPEGQRRRRNRRRFRVPRRSERRCAIGRHRSVLLQPAKAARRAGSTRCRSGDL